MPRGPHFERWLSSEKAGPVRRYAELRPALADVEVSVERYTDQDQYLRSFGLGAPAFPVDGEYVPVEPSNAVTYPVWSRWSIGAERRTWSRSGSTST